MWGLTCLLENVGFVLKCSVGCIPVRSDFTSAGRDTALPVEEPLLAEAKHGNEQDSSDGSLDALLVARSSALQMLILSCRCFEIFRMNPCEKRTPVYLHMHTFKMSTCYGNVIL